MNCNDLVQWVRDNQLMFGLVFSAVVSAMPDQLPGLKDTAGWCWFHDSVKQFLNLKRPPAAK